MSPRRTPRRRRAGFTIVEILMVLIILALLVNAAYESYQSGVDDARFQTMRSHQAMMRRSIEQYFARNQRYPPSLEALTRKYLNRVPDDPLTASKSNDWLVIGPGGDPTNPEDWVNARTPPQDGIFDVRSSAGL